MFKADIVLEISFDVNNPEKTVIKTNAKKEAIEEILSAWLSCQVGQGKDESKPNQQSKYEIKIQLDLSHDNFCTSSDTGNEGITCGIIINILCNLDQIEVLRLS